MMPTTSPPGLDIDALENYFRRELPDLARGPLSARLFAGGKSNLTYAVTDGRTEWVLRRPPLGHVLETAHDMNREYTVMRAMNQTDVPVPEMIAMCTDVDVIGAPFYLMSFVSGTVYRAQEQLDALGDTEATALADNLVEVLARLHRADSARIGLADLGRPAGFLERQIRRWGKQVAASHSRDLPELDSLGTRLAESIPVSARSSIVHGDFKLDNVIVDPLHDSDIVCVLDWEMATLGDPLLDLANLVMWWDGVFDSDHLAITPAPGLVPAFPTSEHLVDRYARITGADLSDFPWYMGFACFKLAGIFEGMYFRQTQGLTVGNGFGQLAGLVPALAARGHQQLAGVAR